MNHYVKCPRCGSIINVSTIQELERLAPDIWDISSCPDCLADQAFMIPRKKQRLMVFEMKKSEYKQKQLERQCELLTAFDLDPDIWNLEWMLTEIQPGSLEWQRGYKRSLRRAIKALKQEKRKR